MTNALYNVGSVTEILQCHRLDGLQQMTLCLQPVCQPARSAMFTRSVSFLYKLNKLYGTFDNVRSIGQRLSDARCSPALM